MKEYYCILCCKKLSESKTPIMVGITTFCSFSCQQDYYKLVLKP